MSSVNSRPDSEPVGTGITELVTGCVCMSSSLFDLLTRHPHETSVPRLVRHNLFTL